MISDMHSLSRIFLSFVFTCAIVLFALASCVSNESNSKESIKKDSLAEREAGPAESYFDNISENVLLFPWPKAGVFQRPDVDLPEPGEQPKGKRRRIEHLFFALPKWWDNFYNWQQQPPTAKAWPNSVFSGSEDSPFNRGGRAIAMQAIKYSAGKSPSMQLFVYENRYSTRPKEYLQQMRRLWQRSDSIREIRAPFVQNFGHRDNYGYLLHFMSREYLYIEFILFLQRRAVHFVFQAPHDELSSKSSIAEFHRLSSKTLEQGIYFRHQRIGEKF